MAKNKLGGRPRSNPKPRPFARKIGAAIKARRVAAGKTRADIATTIKRSESQVFRYESGDIELGIDLLVVVANALGCSAEDLLAAAKT